MNAECGMRSAKEKAKILKPNIMRINLAYEDNPGPKGRHVVAKGAA